MDISCNCFDVATAAKVPVKRYNLLVNAVFPVTEPSVTKPLALSTEKSIKRLTEYLERNEHRIPKVSRRLARRLHADLGRRRYGYVRVAVTAYLSLITAEEGRFSRAIAKELLLRYPTKTRHFWTWGRRPLIPNASQQRLGSVVGALVASKEPLAQLWGINLMTFFCKQQDSAEYIHSLEAFVPLLCDKTAESSRSVQVIQDSQHLGGVPAASFHALLEHLRLCSRISYVSMHLDLITYAVLNVIESEAASLPSSATLSSPPGQQQRAFLSQTSIGTRVGASSPGIAAFLVYQEIGRLTRDAAEGRKVLEFLLRFLDDKPVRWQGGPAVTFGLGVMRDACTHEQQRLMMAAALISHVSSVGSAPIANQSRANIRKTKLTAQARSAVLTQAMKDALSVDASSTVAAPLLLLALQELPKALLLPASNSNDGHQSTNEDPERLVCEKKELEENVVTSIKVLARQQGSCDRLTSVLSAAFSRLPVSESPLGRAGLRCYEAASQACRECGRETQPTETVSQEGKKVSTFLLKAVLGICLRWTPPSRIHAHAILQNISSSGQFSLTGQQIKLIYSTIWHECTNPDTSLAPVNFVSICSTLSAALDCSSSLKELEGTYEIVSQGFLLASSLQCQALSELGFKKGVEERGAGFPRRFSRCWALLATAASLLSRLSLLTGRPELLKVIKYPKPGESLNTVAVDDNICLSLVADFTHTDFTAEDESLAEVQLKKYGLTDYDIDPVEVRNRMASELWKMSSAQNFELAPYFSSTRAMPFSVFLPLAMSDIVPSLSLGLLNGGAKAVEMSATTRNFLASFQSAGGRHVEDDMGGMGDGNVMEARPVLNGGGLVFGDEKTQTRIDDGGRVGYSIRSTPGTVEEVVSDFEAALQGMRATATAGE